MPEPAEQMVSVSAGAEWSRRIEPATSCVKKRRSAAGPVAPAVAQRVLRSRA